MEEQTGSQPEQGASLERLEGILFSEEPKATGEAEPEQTQDETPEPQGAEEAAEGEPSGETKEPEQPAPEPKRHRVKVKGKEYEVSETELINGYQRNEDYIANNEALRSRETSLKAATEAFEKQVQLQQAVQKELAQVAALDAQLAQYANLNWQQLYDADPAQASRLDHQMRMLETARNQAVGKVQQAQYIAAQQMQRRMAEQLENGYRELPKLIPGWKDEMRGQLAEFGKSIGLSAEEVSSISNPVHVKLLWMANEYSKLQTKRPQVEKKVAEAAKPVKPGAAQGAKAATATKDAELRQRLKKSGSTEDAANLIMHRFKL